MKLVTDWIWMMLFQPLDISWIAQHQESHNPAPHCQSQRSLKHHCVWQRESFPNDQTYPNVWWWTTLNLVMYLSRLIHVPRYLGLRLQLQHNHTKTNKQQKAPKTEHRSETGSQIQPKDATGRQQAEPKQAYSIESPKRYRYFFQAGIGVSRML